MDTKNKLYFETNLLTASKINKSYLKICTSAVKDFELSQSEVAILLFLINNPTLDTAKDITAYRGISKALVCKNVESLIRRSFIETFVDDKDKRFIHLKIKPQASMVVSLLKSARNSFFKTLLDGISSQELSVISSVHKKMLNNIESIY